MADITEMQLKVLEKLISDEDFRKGFFDDPDAAIANAGIELSEEEMAGLKAMDGAQFSAAMAGLDARLSKTSVSSFDAGSIEGIAESLSDKIGI